ncbi:MAG: HAD hydrolase family protein [Bacteroidales bacterium]|nr:HAD hydrolase family protein [Bacteroidales bacterium]
MSNFKEALKQVKAFAFDVDGVFSKQLYLTPEGKFMRTMNVKDGLAVKMAIDLKYPIAIISGGKEESIIDRFKGLGMTDFYIGSLEKREALEDFMSKYELNPDEILYMGDDLPDYEPMQIVGVATCPSDAVEEIKSIAYYISDRKGGDACVRDVIEQVLRVQGNWPKFN